MLRYEIKRIIYNKTIFLTVLLGVFILLFSGYMEVKDFLFMDFNAPDLQSPEQKQAILKLVDNALNKYNFFASTLNFYTMFIPIISSIFALTYNEDLKYGMIKNINIRISNKKYVLNKIFINSIIGGLLSIVPIIIVIIFSNMFLKGSVFEFSANGHYGGIFSNIFTYNTILYYFIFLLIEFAIGLVYSNVALAISTKIKSKIAVLFLPFVFYMGLSILCNFFNIYNWSPELISQFYFSPNVHLKNIIIELLVIFIISVSIFLFFSRKKNIYE